METRTTKKTRLSEEELDAFQKQLTERDRKFRMDQDRLEREMEQLARNKERELESINEQKRLMEIERKRMLEANDEEKAELKRTAVSLREENNQLRRVQRNPSTVTTMMADERQGSIDRFSPASGRENYVSLKEASEFIPRFNGHNQSVFQFSRTCEQARDMLSPSSEYYFVQIILNKLYGHAAQIMQDLEVNTIVQLLNTLKDTFAPRKTLNQYKGELANLYQMPKETILDYIGRVKELKIAILDCERQRKGIVTGIIREEIESDILSGFVMGLLPPVRTNLKIEGYNNLQDAVTKSIQIAKQLDVDQNRYRNRTENFVRETRSDRPSQNNYNINHSSSQNNRDNAKLNPQASTFQPRNNPQWQERNQISCSYCKSNGHVREECRKLAYRREHENKYERNQEPQPGTSAQSKPRTVNFFGVPTEPPPPPDLQRSDWDEQRERHA